ncbi:MAG TPA: aminotransferase class IV, partial [Planctomycetota bacterium]|nr:aminotransferase class IV [Planctomycetota bacterium]
MSDAPRTLYSINGRIVPEEKAVVPVTDRGFLYGDGVFETLHAYGHTLFRQQEHLQRLRRGAEALYFKPLPSLNDLARQLKRLVDAADFAEANVRLTVTRGTGPRGPSISGTYSPNVIITATEFHRPPEERLRAGARAIFASFRRQESAATAKLKTLNYIEQILARREADEAGADEALLLNNAGLLCEGSASNISLVSGGVLRIPDPDRSGALPGIAQLTAIEAARNLNIPVVMTALSPWDPAEADEAFLSGSMREITPLVRIGDAVIGSGKPGPVTLALIAEYRRIVE